MKKTTLTISNNQASVSITMPSTPPPNAKQTLSFVSSNNKKENDQSNQSINSTYHSKNIFIGDKSPTCSPTPVFNETEMLNISNNSRYPSQSFNKSQANYLSSQISGIQNFQQPSQQNYNKLSQQDLEEQYFATTETSGSLNYNTFNQSRQKSIRNKPKLLRQANAELIELPQRLSRERLPSATPSSFSNFSGSCAFSANYSAGLTHPFTKNQSNFNSTSNYLNYEQANSSNQNNTSKYYSYWEDANSFVAASANATANAAAAASSNFRGAFLISSSQPTQSQQSNYNYTEDYSQNNLNNTHLAFQSSQTEVDSSYQFIKKFKKRCRSVPLLTIYINDVPNICNEEINSDLKKCHINNRDLNNEKELITFIDFLEEKNNQTKKTTEKYLNEENNNVNNSKTDTIEEDSKKTDTENLFDNKTEFFEKQKNDKSSIKFGDKKKLIESSLVKKNEENSRYAEEKENFEPYNSGSSSSEDLGEFSDSELSKLLPSTFSNYSLFQKIMNKHGNKDIKINTNNQNLTRKYSSDIESQNLLKNNHHCHCQRRCAKKSKEKKEFVVIDDLFNNDESINLCKTSKKHELNSKTKKAHRKIKQNLKNKNLEFFEDTLIENNFKESKSLPTSRSMLFSDSNNYDQTEIKEIPSTKTKEMTKSPKIEKKKKKFSKKALHLLKVNHFRKSKSVETGKELEISNNKTLSAICKARSYNYNLIRNMNENLTSQQSSILNSVNNSYEENYHLINSGNSPILIESYYGPTQNNQSSNQYQRFLIQENLNKSINSQNYYKNNSSFKDQLTSQLNDNLLAIHIHNTDRKLKSSKGIVNPVVKMHVVNLSTGEYLYTKEFITQSSIGANAGIYTGPLQGKEYIQPITTQPCDLLFKLKYPEYPIWEELLVLKESLNYLKQNDVILFFEILDFVKVEHSDLLNNFKLKHWCYRVAWGYFLLSNLQNHTDQMIKLQLYKPYLHTIEKNFDPYCQVYNWWKNYKRINYPASLYITLTSVSIEQLNNLKHPIHLRILDKASCKNFLKEKRSVLNYLNENVNDNLINQNINEENINDQLNINNFYLENLNQNYCQKQDQINFLNYSKMTLQPNQFSNLNQSLNHQNINPSSQITQVAPVSIQSGQTSSSYNNLNLNENYDRCKLPSSTWHQLSAGNNKCCYNVAFSNDGTKIACCASVFTAYISTEKRSSIFIYDIPGGKFLQRVNGFHSAPIYYLDWSKGDKLLASASADYTCLVWQMRRAHCAPLVLNHPCFVYTVKFHPTNQNQLATGSLDGSVRIWCIQESLKSTIKEPVLLQCVTAIGSVAAATFHGKVLALCWINILIDYLGPNGSEKRNELLLFSGCSKGNLMALKQDKTNLSWQPYKKMKIKEISNIAINEIKFCVNNSRLILFCRDGVQRMVDVISESITMRYIGSLNFNHLIRGCLSTDGKFLFAGSEDALVHVWNVDTGERIYTYNNLPFRGSIASIHYHPSKDILAVSGLNARTISVCLYKHPDINFNSPTILRKSNEKNQSQSNTNYQPSISTSVNVKESMVTTNSAGQTTVSFAHDEYDQPEIMLMMNKSVGSLNAATSNEKKIYNKKKHELKKSHTIDHSSNSSNMTLSSKTNQKVQKAMRKLELALRLSFNEKS